MRKENYLNNCVIFDKFIQDDLVSYGITDSSNSFTIDYENNKSFDISIKTDLLREIYELNLFGADERTVNVWYPVFIWNDDYISTKLLTQEGSVKNSNDFLKSGRLGIEEFISFKPLLQNWSISNDAQFSIDWTLNRPQFPYSLQYGLMYWYKRLPAEDQLLEGGNRFLYNLDNIENFPNYSKLSTNSLLKTGESLSGVTLIKLDNSTFFRTDKDNSIFEKDTIDFSSEAILKISDFDEQEDVKFFLFSKEGENTGSILGTSTRATLYVPDGECFSYFENYADQSVSLSESIMSKTYLSPSLYSTYKQIYHVLTLDKKKLINSGLDLKTSRIVKKIAYVLSSSPVMSEFGINFLDSKEIRDYISEQIETINVTSLDQEIKSVSDLIVGIHVLLNKLGIDNKLSQKTLNNNLINGRKQLFKKLMSKYGGYINIQNESSLEYKSQLKYGDSVHIQQLMLNYCDKNLRGEKNSPLQIYNNQSISLNTIKIETQIDEEETTIKLQKKTAEGNINKSLPLSDFARKALPELDLNIEMEKTSNVEQKFKIQQAESSEDWSPLNYVFETQNLPFAAQSNETEIHFRIIDDSLFSTSDKIERIFSDPTEKISVLWESVYGDCLRFTDSNRTPMFIGGRRNPAYNFQRYNKSTQLDPYVYVYKTGEYKIKCTANTPNGVFVKTKTFYVVVGTQKISEGEVPFYGYYTDIGENDPISIWNYEDSSTGQRTPVVLTLKPPPIDNVRVVSEATPVKIGSDFVKVVCPSMTDVAINKIGMFWPRKTFLSYANDTFSDNIENYPLGGQDKFFFGETGENVFINSSNATLRLGYTTNNTKVAISKIVLRNIRNETKECSQCLSFYKPTMTTQVATPAPTTITNPNTGEVEVVPSNNIVRSIRNSKYPDGELVLISFRQSPRSSSNRIIKGPIETFYYPHVSTKNAPKIKPYGGYGADTIEKIGIPIPNSPLLLNDLTFEEYPPTTGYRMDYQPDPIQGFRYDDSEMKVCYQKAMSPGLNYFTFEKGTFHPSTGWIYYDSPNYNEKVKNLSSVLKFNPGARETYSFTGPGLYDLKSSFNNKNENKAKVYQSAIELDISKYIQWDPLIADCAAERIDELKEQKRKENQLNKEYSDQLSENAQSMKHGYRYLEGGFLKLAETTRSNNESQNCDEFGFSVGSSRSCDSEGLSINSYKYSFPVTGPSYQITKENIEKVNLRNPRVNSLSIQDIEVKLNFLNYVNTKNLVVWLDVYFSEEELKSLKGNENRAGSPTKAGKEFVNQSLPPDTYGLLNQRYEGFPNITDKNITDAVVNEKLIDYLDNLVYMNSTDGSPHRIYLINQDHIQNSEYNFSIKFSDHASNNNVTSNENFCNTSGININQNIINNEYDIQPTISASGYSDRESSSFKNAIRNNQINITNNKFSKFKGRILFQKPIPETEKGPCQYDPTYDSSTRFVLNFAVLDENDEMNVYDNINNMQFLSNYESGDTRRKSSDISSSLCSWELILHTGKTKKPVPNTLNGLNNYGSSNAMGLIEYGKDPQYPGYSFIADLTKNKNFLPSVNLNAPNPAFYIPSEICDYANPEDKPKFASINPPDFPEWAINAIVMQFAGTVAASAGTAVGISALLSSFSFNIGYNALFDFFKSNRIYQETANKLRNFYVPKYESYPFGSPEKVLLNVSKDGVFWYKLEASIFRYDNTPALENTKYGFVRLNKDIIPAFSNFEFTTINNIIEIIDKSFIETVTVEDCINNTDELLSYLKTENLVQDNVVLDIKYPDDCNDLSGLYIIDNDSIYSIVNKLEKSYGNLLRSEKFLQKSSGVRGDYQFITQSEFESNRVIIMESKIPFYVFDKQNIVELYSDSNDSSPILSTVEKKYLIFKNNKYYTVLVFDQSAGDKNYVSLKDKDCILVFKPQQTNVLDYPINIWSFEKEKIKQRSLQDYYSLNSVGSVGDGSYQVDKDILDYLPNSNNVNNLYQIFNNNENDKLKYNNFTIINTEFNQFSGVPVLSGVTGVSENITNSKGAAGFAIDLIDANLLYSNEGFKTHKNRDTSDKQLSDLIDSLDYSVGNIQKNKIQMMIIKAKDLEPTVVANSADLANNEQEQDLSLLELNYGYLSIEEDFSIKTNVKQIKQTDIDSLVQRLDRLEYTGSISGVSDFIGTKTRTNTIIENGSIDALVKHYNSLEEDGIECLDRRNKDNKNCYKKRTKQAIYNAYKERDDIIQLLGLQAKRKINENQQISYEPLREEDERIFYHIDVSITGHESENDNKVRSSESIKIEYEDKSSNYYWINIDPKQSCTLASEANPRVLTKTKYKCAYAYSNSSTFPVNNNVCPRFATGGSFSNIIDGISDIIFAPGEDTSDEIIDSAGTEFTYSIPQEKIAEQKKQLEGEYPQIAGWTTITIDRVFTINNDSDIASSKNGIFIPSQDIIVEATETYEVAIPWHENNNLVPVYLKDDGSADGVDIEDANQDPDQQTNYRSRIGLMDYTGGRDTKPSRVHNIFNLDDVGNLFVQFRKIPRMIKGVDYRNTVYRYGVNGSVFRPIVGEVPPVEVATDSSLNNLFYYWQCLQRNEKGEWKYANLPDFYKILNEMEFRGFFGSTDYIENKDPTLESLYPWEIVPYEYDTTYE